MIVLERRKHMRCALLTVLALYLTLSLCACGASNSTWQEQYDLGVRYLSEGNYEEAIIAFTAVIEINPKNVDAFLGRASAYIGSGETEENLAAALADYQSVLELDDTRADAYLGMADVYIRQGDYEKAQRILEQGFEKTGDQSISAKLEEIKAGTITDSSGKTRRKSGYDATGTLAWYHTYSYDTQGRQSSVSSFDASGSQTGHVDIQHDSNGNRLTNYYWNNSGKVGKITYERNDVGKVTCETHYTLDGEMSYYNICEYDRKDNLAKENRYNADGALLDYYVYTYDLNGNEVRRDIFSADGTLCSYETTTYHDNGHRDVYSFYNADGALEGYWVDQYDEEWNYIGEKHYDASGNLTSSTVSG